MSKPTKPAQQLTPFGYALAGALGGVFSNAVVYPLDTVKTRIQASSSASKKGKERQQTVVQLLLRILKEEGIAGFYQGFGASMLNTFSMQYAYFFFYSLVRGAYLRRLSKNLPKGAKPPPISTAMELLLGAIAGALGQIFTIPVSVIATRQQVGRAKLQGASPPPSELSSSNTSHTTMEDKEAQLTASPSRKEKFDNSFLGVARDIIREDGITGLWLGLKASLVLTVNPAITYGFYERVKSLYLLAKEKAGAGGSDKLTPLQSFFLGAVSKTLATIVTYPYIMAKVRIQAGTADEKLPGPSTAKKHKHDGAVELLARVLREQGFLGWYQGMNAQITKAVLTQALLFVSKDQFEQYALMIMNAHSRLVNSN